jgi:hypothetical protein
MVAVPKTPAAGQLRVEMSLSAKRTARQVLFSNRPPWLAAVAPTTAKSWRGITMQDRKYSRRDVFKASTALAVGAVFAEPVKAAAPPPSAVTPALIDFTADDPGPTLLRCHHQDHQDEGFMGLVTYL